MNTDTIDALRSEWDALQPLAPEQEARLWQKLRLEWNYHSNHIEGNTLTYGETQLLLIHGQTHGNHSLRDYEEMKAHDVGIAHLRTLAADPSRSIAEADIRDLNKIILKEPFFKAAQTPDGSPTRKWIVPGEYKTAPNNVLTAAGEIFEFATPADVPARMQELVTWLAKHDARSAAEILPLITRLHHEFVLIHPFDDGNGRVARMLVNYVLMRAGYLPLVVRTENKQEYLSALRLADGGDPTDLAVFLGNCIERSLRLGIRAAKGESVDEPGDTEKKIALFVQEQKSNKDRVVPRSPEAIRQVYDTGIRGLTVKLIEKMKLFEPLFVRVEVSWGTSEGALKRPISEVTDVLRRLDRRDQSFTIGFIMEGYTGAASEPFNADCSFQVEFESFNYHLFFSGTKVLTHLYSEPLTDEEINFIIEKFLSDTFEAIKAKTV